MPKKSQYFQKSLSYLLTLKPKDIIIQNYHTSTWRKSYIFTQNKHDYGRSNLHNKNKLSSKSFSEIKTTKASWFSGNEKILENDKKRTSNLH